MDKIHVQSSNIAMIGYEPETETLEIDFLNGSTYQYKNVPQVIYDGLMTAPSH
jgi:hypothetical protein